mmetsp:Transcript_38705/g.84190  ORF Transcript_38705/g.84190 Transcript_38705/m.84190 type:complete len:201 (+) Transcript_38705:2363-2965(+)
MDAASAGRVSHQATRRRHGVWCCGLLCQFSQGLTHESDGLIFQASKDPYAPFTCHELLKWKPAHMNSVDFLLVANPGAQPRLAVGGSGQLVYLDDQRLTMPPGVDVSDYNGLVIECAWDKVMSCWTFMRTRPDKDTPNHISTYEKVCSSIKDNITQTKLLAVIEGILESKANEPKHAGHSEVPSGQNPYSHDDHQYRPQV